MATPVLEDLRHHYPEAKITAMCLSQQSALLTHDPHLDAVFGFSRPSGWIRHMEHSDVFFPLRQGKYDLGLLLTNSFSSAWWFWRSHVKNRLGYVVPGRCFLLNKAVPHAPHEATEHQVVTYKRLLEPLGIPLSKTAPKLYLSPEALQRARASLHQKGVPDSACLVGINPGAAYGTAKCWLPERFKELTLRLLEDPEIFILYFGDHASAPVVNAICQEMPDRVLNFAGKTSLQELMAFIKCCKVLVTNDSGPMHIAAALGIPPLALFGSTSEVKTSPYQMGKVIHKHVECSPCYRRVCPIDFRCMKRIEVEEVYRELKERML